MTRTTGGRNRTWKRLCIEWWALYGNSKEYAAGFNGNVQRIAGELKRYLADRIDGTNQLPALNLDDFVDSLPKVLGACNADIYDSPGAADTYAFIHLVDRYRRTWQVLERLLACGSLPFHSQEIRILDVGAGPCASSWAAQDFYTLIQSLASKNQDLQRICKPAVVVHTVERSIAMQQFGHWFSEFSGRPGPFQAEFANFVGISPINERRLIRDSAVRELVQEWDYTFGQAVIQVNVLDPSWRHHGRYHLILFSNFLTEDEVTATWQTEVKSLFRELYAGGTVCIIGGTGEPYPSIYARVDEYASSAALHRVEAMPESLPNNYQDVSAGLLKTLFNYVIQDLLTEFQRSKAKGLLPRAQDIWDPNTRLKGPAQFGIRVYRTPNRKDRRQSRQSIKAGTTQRGEA